ncbi:DNA adenine methylase (plasmid) [Citricoccus nitrophenolicus]
MSRYVSPLRYPGGKAKMAPYLAEAFADHLGPMDVEIWMEPFAGGAGAGLTALLKHQVPELWLVEYHPALAAFWQQVVEGPEPLARAVETTTPSLALFDRCRQTVADALAGESVDQFEAAYAAFMVNRLSRSGILSPTAGPIGGRGQTGRWKIGDRFNPTALAERLRLIGGLGSRIKVTHGDGIERIAELSDSGVEDEVLLFVDPPYVVDGDRLYAQGMSGSDHALLAQALAGCPSPWALTYDAHPEVARLYAGHRTMEFEIPHTANKRAIDTEYLVLSDNLAVPDANPLGRGDHWWVGSRDAAVA